MKLTEFVIKNAILPNLEEVRVDVKAAKESSKDLGGEQEQAEIAIGSSANTKESVIRKMVASLKASGAFDPKQEEEVVAAILKREELGSTGIGNGVAVPHTKHKSVEKLSATVAISRNGVDFASLDDEPVFIFFLLISPPDRPGDHLRGLENISRNLRSLDFCNFLRQSTTTDDIWDLLLEADQSERDT